METHKAAKIPCCFLCTVFSWTKASSTGVILNISVRDGKVILACTLARDSPVSLGCDEYLMGSASNWHKDVPPFWEAVMYQPWNVAGPVPMGWLVRSVMMLVQHWEHFLWKGVSVGWLTRVSTSWCRGGYEPCVAISSHLCLFWKLYYGPETENCPQINWILETNWWIHKLIMKAAWSM